MVKKKALEPENIPLPDLLDALRNEDEPFPPRYLYRLSDLSPEDVEVFGEVWSDVAVWRRRAMLQDILEISETNTALSFEALDRLALRDPDPQVRRLALEDLDEYDVSDLIPDYLNFLKTDPDENVRAEAASVLGYYIYMGELEELDEEIHHKIEDELLLAAKSSSSEIIRKRALESLGYSSRPEVMPLIQNAYESPDRNWVVSALFAISRSYNQDWAGQVLNMLGSTYPNLRAMAARAAGELELEDALDPLVEMLDDDNDDARMAAIWSLSQIGGEGVREHLDALAKATDDDDEAELIQDALDNLEFTEDIKVFDILDINTGGASELQPKERASVSKPKGWESEAAGEDDSEADFEDPGDDDEYLDDEVEDFDDLDDLDFDDDLDTGGNELDDDFDDEEGMRD